LISTENAENMQIQHYEHGQKYDPHFDYFNDKINQVLEGHRYATVLMYRPPSTREARPCSPMPRYPQTPFPCSCGVCPLRVLYLSTDECGILTLPARRDGSPSPRMTLSLSVHTKDWQVISLTPTVKIWHTHTMSVFKNRSIRLQTSENLIEV